MTTKSKEHLLDEALIGNYGSLLSCFADCIDFSREINQSGVVDSRSALAKDKFLAASNFIVEASYKDATEARERASQVETTMQKEHLKLTCDMLVRLDRLAHPRTAHPFAFRAKSLADSLFDLSHSIMSNISNRPAKKGRK